MIMASKSLNLVMWEVMILVLVLGKAEYCNSSSNNSSVGCLERERVALLQLKSTFNNPKPNRAAVPWAGWALWVDEDDSNCCEWPMIECHPYTGRIIALYLNYTSSLRNFFMDSWYLNVSMFLPFEELKNLNLSGNSIGGFIGNEGFERLSDLEVLDLNGNNINNSVLAYLNGLSSLKYLDLSLNSLEGPTHFNNNFGRLSRLTNLEFLDLSNNLLSCSIKSFMKLEDFINLKELHFEIINWGVCQGMEDLSALGNLEVLNLGGNYLNNNVFTSIRSLSKLKILDLSNNDLEGSIAKEIYTLSNLEKLDMAGNKIDSFVNPEELEEFINLKELHLKGNGMRSFLGREESSAFSNLEFLDLSNNKLNKSIFASIRGLSKLKFLDLRTNDLEGSIDTKELFALSNLEELYMNENMIDNFLNAEGMKGLPNLKILEMRNNHLEASVENFLTGLRNASSLKILILDGAIISSKTLQSIRASTSLHILSLVNCTGLRNTLHSQGLCELINLQELYLDGIQLEGTLSQCWGNFSFLRKLSLSHNNFIGNISSSPLSILTSLENLAIDGNQFKIPISFRPFYNHSNLKALRCDDNILIPEVELNNWAPKFQLEHFSFSNGNKDKPMAFPSFLCYQYNLIYLYASNNNLNGTFPSCLFHNNSKLQILQLEGNSFVGPLEWPRGPNPSIQILDLSENKLVGRIPPNISLMFPNLRMLELSTNYFYGNIISHFHDMVGLEVLDLSNNQLSGVMPENFLSNCSSMQILELSNNAFSGKLSPAAFNMTTLEHLWLSGNNFTGDIQENFPLMSLRTLDIRDNHFSGELSRWIGNMTSIYGMLMSRNHFRCQISMEFCKLNALRILDLSGNNLYGSMAHAFYNNTELEILDLGINNISGSIPSWIGGLPKLSILLLKANYLEGEIPTQVCQLSRLRIMDLSQNRLSGSLPFCLGAIPFQANETSIESLDDVYTSFDPFSLDFRGEGSLELKNTLKSLIEAEFTTKKISYFYKGSGLSLMSGVDLSCNQLTGEIPPEIGNLSNIHALNLSENNFTGSIPTTFVGLRQVESLDLSYNKLSGRIPPQLIQLNYLSAFSVAHNNLSGMTPDQKAQFTTFNERSYEGNPFLCGAPILHDNCSKIGSSSPMLNSSSLHTNDSLMEAFYISFLSSYVVILLGIAIVLYINPSWREAWFYFIEICMMTSYYFIVDNFSKLQKFIIG